MNLCKLLLASVYVFIIAIVTITLESQSHNLFLEGGRLLTQPAYCGKQRSNQE